MKLFVTAIGTDCGKTLVSAILCEALKADYWKPVQTGSTYDAERIKELVSFPIHLHPERHLLQAPVSPHYAAQLEGKQLRLADFELPYTTNHLIVEGAGGILVPLDEKGDFIIDIASKLDLEVVLVIRLYLGAINHALLSLHELKRRGITIKGLVFNGDDHFGAISLITGLHPIPILLHIQEEEVVLPESIEKYALQCSFPSL